MENFIKKYEGNAPRYTSYPTAPHFNTDIRGEDYSIWLSRLPEKEAISLYLHVPFCKSMCLYCGCNTKIVDMEEPIRAYSKTMKSEIKMVSDFIGKKLPVSHIAWGGGTPSMMPADEMEDILKLISERFELLYDTEIAVEMDPRILTKDRIFHMAEIGVNRASLGVQDFNNDVQKAIGRIQPFDMVKETVDNLRDAGINSINFDLIYGMPFQNIETVANTARQAAALSPDRLAVFGYAHVPWFKKHQEKLEEYPRGDSYERYLMNQTYKEELIKAGYIDIGIDHFAKKDDEMAISFVNKTLNRNFQGYTTDKAETLLGFGVSSIGATPQGYVQSTTLLKQYREKIAKGELPVVKGIKISDEDKLRRKLIMNIMCYFEVDISPLDKANREKVKSKIAPFIQDDLVEFSGNNIIIKEKGRSFTRLIATSLDTYIDKGIAKHSQAV